MRIAAIRLILNIVFQVCHSQRLNDPPLKPWVACHKSGQVLAAHCTCKAGLGEVCSHIAATLFFMEAIVKRKQETACTSLPCEWIKPGGKGQYKEAIDIDFSSVQAKKRRIDGIVDAPSGTTKTTDVAPMTDEEANKMFADLKASGVRCAVLSLVDSYADAFIPAAASTQLPAPLSTLFSEENSKLSASDLNVKCKEVLQSLVITPEQVVNMWNILSSL